MDAFTPYLSTFNNSILHSIPVRYCTFIFFLQNTAMADSAVGDRQNIHCLTHIRAHIPWHRVWADSNRPGGNTQTERYITTTERVAARCGGWTTTVVGPRDPFLAAPPTR